MYNVENMLQPGDCGTTLGWAEVISLQGRYFPKSIFPIVNFPRVYFSTWQLPECANSQAAASKVCPIYSARSPTLFYLQRSVPYPVLPAALGPLPSSTQSARSPTLFYPQRSVTYPVLPSALGPLPCYTHSARSPSLFYPQRSVPFPVLPAASASFAILAAVLGPPLSVWKWHIWEAAIGDIVTWDVALGKRLWENT